MKRKDDRPQVYGAVRAPAVALRRPKVLVGVFNEILSAMPDVDIDVTSLELTVADTGEASLAGPIVLIGLVARQVG